MIRRILLFLTLAGMAIAQTDAPPELAQPFAPDQLPPVGAPPKAPINGKLTVDFSGGTAFRLNQLRDGIARQIQSIEEYGLDEAGAYDAAFFLESFYRRHGYASVHVKSEIVGPWTLRLSVEEGPVAHIGTITIEGNTGFDDKTLSNYLLGPIRERFPRIRQDFQLPFVEADIFSGTDLVRRLYAADGWLDSVVEPPEVTFNSDSTVANILLRITEGTQYRFGSIKLAGSLVFPKEELLKVIAEQTKDIYTDGRLAAAERALEDFYQKRGYFAIDVTGSGDLAAAKGGQVPVVFQIKPGDLYHFEGGVTVAGTDGVNPAFIQQRLKSLQGKTYDPRLVDRTFRELIQTGLFRNLRITPQSIGNGKLRLDVSVEEAKPKEFGVGLGYASFFGGIVSATYRDLNFFGSGRPFSVNAEINMRGFNGEVIYTDPWFLESDYQLRLRLYGVNSVLRGYTKNEFGFQPTLSRWLTKHWSVSAFIRAKAVGISDVEIEPESLVGSTRYSVGSIGISQTFDLRNNTTLPTRGLLFTTSLELAPNGIGDVAFIRALGAFSYYIPITAKSTLSLGARAGVISPLNDKGLPIDERFFNGGATTVRSFSELTLGPRDRAGYPLGGQGFTVFNVEYNFPLYGDLFGAVFVDAGNVISEAGDFGLDGMRYAVGAGLRYNLPIGAIRLDYGLNPSPRQGEAQGAFQFAIGVAF
jgi:outer membrane protein assembly complex protein YaeT